MMLIVQFKTSLMITVVLDLVIHAPQSLLKVEVERIGLVNLGEFSTVAMRC